MQEQEGTARALAPRVLIADDSRTVRDLVRRILGRVGMEVIEAVDGIDAISTTMRERPDVVLLDLHMPCCDGIEAVRRLSAMPETSHIPFLLLTSNDDARNVATALDAGARDYVRKPCQPAELVARVNRALKHAQEVSVLQRSTVTDELTGLPNRRGMQLMLDALSSTDDEMLAIAVIDADHFKRINDDLGHHAGDIVLREIARRLGAAWPTVRVARWGGEEFLAFFTAPDADEVAVVADRMRAAVADRPILVEGDLVPMTVSIGVAVAAHRNHLDDAMTEADAAVYEAKASGRNRVVVRPISSLAPNPGT